MPKGLPKVKVSSIQPTPEELETARVQLAALTDNQIVSKKASLRQFLNKSPDKAILDKSRSDEFMEKFHVHVMRSKTTEKKWMSERSVFVHRQQVKTLTWMSEEEMEHKYGSHPVFAKLFCL